MLLIVFKTPQKGPPNQSYSAVHAASKRQSNVVPEHAVLHPFGQEKEGFKLAPNGQHSWTGAAH
eukprot:1145879-Pelagomonas_calceolata.AAC.1